MHGYSDRINHALAFTAKHYRPSVPPWGGMGHIAHPANVGLILARYGCDQPTIVAGIVHHVLEELPPHERAVYESKISEKFGPVVLAVALDASELRYDERGERPWRARKLDLGDAEPRALDIIAADEIHRCGSMIAATRRLGVEYLRTVSQATSEQILWWYRSMLEVLTARGDWPQRTMLDEIRSLSADLIRTLRQQEEDF
jgi:hypothetical protein